jgi:hypothetical protein
MPAGMTDRSVEPVGQNFSDGVWPMVFDVCTLIRVERYNLFRSQSGLEFIGRRDLESCRGEHLETGHQTPRHASDLRLGDNLRLCARGTSDRGNIALDSA